MSVLIVTDVLARGMDLDCDAVINMEMPEDPLVYAHRAGRTGRMGREGTVVTLVTPFLTRRFAELQKGLGVKIPERRLFKGELIDEKTYDGEAPLPPAIKPRKVWGRASLE